MNRRNSIVQKGVSLLLIMALIMTGLFSYSKEAYAIMAEKTVTKYHLDLGAQHIWGNGDSVETATWQNGNNKGGAISVSASIVFPREVSNVRAFELTSSNFQWNQEGNTFNSTPYLNSEYDYISNYEKFTSSSIYGISCSSNGNTVNLSYTATLDSIIDFNLKNQLNMNGLEYILDLLGGESTVQSKYPDTYNRLVEGATNGIAPNVYGFMYFTPVVIQYDVKEMVKIGDLDAELSLPSSAKQGESYIVSDASNIDPSLSVSTAVLEKQYGDGNWQDVITWEGRGPGQHTGGSISQNEPDIGTITYRLTVTTTNGQVDSDTKSINITDARELEGVAILKLPASTYEGHKVEAVDQSEFTVDSVAYSARRMYEEDLASNSFKTSSLAGASTKRLGLTNAEITFPKKGHYAVTLEVKTKDGKTLTDMKPIEVLKTPAVTANLGGVQKQNRKQVLNIVVATNPDYPLTELWVQLQDQDGTERVKLHKSGSLENSETIKTRAIENLNSNEYFTRCKLEFLTKNSEEEIFTYTVFAKDTRGYTDQVESEFTVKPDFPPDAKINIEDTFIRNQGTNIAKIIMEDFTQTDGDQVERTWHVLSKEDHWEKVKDLEGYSDLSFGTGKKVTFDRTGVGKVNLRLDVKDHWVEETLPEYITEADYLSSSIEAQTDVINIPPVVSIEPISIKTANILMLAGGQREYDILLSNKTALQEQLIEKGVDGLIKIDKLTPQASKDEGLKTTMSVSLPFGYNGGDSFLESKWYAVDENNLYTINATWTSSYHDTFPQMPYYITSYDANTGMVNWSYTLTRDIMDISGGNTRAERSFARDDTGTYLFFRYGGKTLVLSKDTGAYLTCLNLTLGDDNYVYNNSIYTIQPDGIYSISTQTGNVKKVYNGNVSGKTRRINDDIHFLTQTGATAINRGFLDLSTEKARLARMPETAADTVGTTYTCIGIDAEGAMMVGINNSASVRAYSNENAFVKSISGWNTARSYSVLPVYDEKGKCTHIAAAWENKGTSTYWSYAGVWGIHDNLALSKYIQSTNGFQADATKPMYAGKIGDKITFQLGSMWAGLYGGGGVMGYYTEKATAFVFDTVTHAAYVDYSSPFAFGVAGEYGRKSDTIYAPTYTYNVDQQEIYETGLNTKVVAWGQTMDEVLYRYLTKYGIGKDDYNTVVVFDDTNEEEEDPLQLSLDYLRDKVPDFLFARSTVEDGAIKDILESYGQRMVDALKESGQRAATLIKGSQFVKDVAALIAQDGNTPKKIFAVSNSSGTGTSSISREYNLDADKTYYFEYDLKHTTPSAIDQPLHWSFIEDQAVPAENLLPEPYYVTGMETEDFDDEKCNPFFKNVAAGRLQQGEYHLATLNSGKTSLPNYVYSDSGEIRFTVPEGKKAILSFDYNAKSEDGYWANTSFYINDKRWDKLQFSNPLTGTYTHSEFLPQGENTIKASCIDYGTRPFQTWAILDNLKVTYVENQLAESKQIVNLYHSQGQDQTFIAPYTGAYELSLYGPSSDSKAGLIKATVRLMKGDVLEAYLGPQIDPASGGRDGAYGLSGSGYGDSGIYKATLSINGDLAMIVGGGAQNGNPGAGNGSYIRRASYGQYETCMCGASLKRNESCYHDLYNGTGGSGGQAGIGGAESVTSGTAGTPGSSAYWSGSGRGARYYYAGGKGGNGGSGGASYIEPSHLEGYEIRAGESPGQSRLKIIYNPMEGHKSNPIGLESSWKKVEAEDGWNHYNGTLRTPFQTTAYRGQDMEYHYEDFTSGRNHYAIRNVSDPDNKTLQINVPSGKTAINTGVNILSYPARSSSNSWNVTWNWTTGGRTWNDLGIVEYGNVPMDIPSPNLRLSMPHLTGTHQFMEKARAANGSSGQFNSVELYMVEEMTPQISEGKFFFDKEREIVYLENDQYAEKAIFTFDGGTSDQWYIRDFNIYSMENGVKVYVTEEEMTGASQASKWATHNADMAIIKDFQGNMEEEEETSVIYKKGELVAYDIFYSDYEEDPSKKQYWKYTHTPFNDGPHPDAAVILDEAGTISAITGKVLNQSIPRFYIDGKYTVEHWQEDNTNRTGDPSSRVDYEAYDKASNVAALTFYIEGGASAPWITSIKTIPPTVKEMDYYQIQVGVDDMEKDVLSLTTEVYKEKKLIYTHRQWNIQANEEGNYPRVITGTPPPALSGIYEIVCTVRDETGAGLGSYKFLVVSEGRITGFVNHTVDWDLNRKKYNLKRFSDEINYPILMADYLNHSLPRPRGTNVFWSGERFMLEAETEGTPNQVMARIYSPNSQGALMDTGFSTTLSKSGKKGGNGGDLWTGSLWDNGMINKWGRRTPQSLLFKFAAEYPGGKIKEDEATVIVDSQQDYWQLHRLW